jgi:class 3 adenylate cyclase/tetratricopeptide (TPR) repeat protein
MRCPSCKAENPDATKFCGNCGQPLTNRCAKCGAKNPPQFKFCGECGVALINLADGVRDMRDTAGSEGERRHLTVLFCDLVGSTALAAQLDPEDWRSIVADYHHATADAIERFGGYVAKYLGDGVMAYFGWPVAHDNDAERAARAGLAILDAIGKLNKQPLHTKLSARVGIDSGGVVVGTGAGKEADVFGDVPNIAARVQATAEPGTVEITGATHRLISGLFVVEDRGAQELKGIERPLQLYRVVRPSGIRGRFPAMAAMRGMTPFVGREDELRSLLHRWERVLEGEGQVVTIIGEAGIGKSRLVQRFREEIAATPYTWLECATAPFFQNTPFYAVADMLQQSFRWDSSHTVEQRLAALEAALGLAGLVPDEALPLIAPLLELPVGTKYSPSSMAPDEQRKRLLATLVGWTFGAAKAQPLVIATEDLHWADPSTLELTQLLVEQRAAARLLLLYTARPEFHAPWPIRAHHTQINLTRLTAGNVRTMIAQVAAKIALSDETVATVIERTGGVPLFVEELTRAVLEDRTNLAGRAIPATLRDSLMARLDRLGPAKEVAQVGAVIGGEFSYELLQAVHPMAEENLQSGLRKLADAELVYVRGVAPDATYQFKHTLIRDTAYEALLKTNRRKLHRLVAQTITEKFPTMAEAQPEVLARHWTEAGEMEPAIAAWTKAAKAANVRGAVKEAEEDCRQALAMLENLPETTDRDQRMLGLVTLLSSLLQKIGGYSAPETVEVLARARTIAEKTGDLAQLVVNLMGTWAATFVAGDYPSAETLGGQILDLARREGSPTSLATAHSAQILLRFHCADLLGIEEHLVPFRRFVEAGGLEQSPDTIVNTLAYASLCAWFMGRPDLARTRMGEAVALSEKKAFTVAAGRRVESYLYRWLRDAEQAAKSAALSVSISEKHGFGYYTQLPIAGWARAHLGYAAEGISLLRESVRLQTELSIGLDLTNTLTMLAEAQALNGEINDALGTLDTALVSNLHETVFRPNILTLRGELRLRLGQNELAEADLREAIALAHEMNAKALELRASIGLARLLERQGRHDEARTMLADIYNWFSEGFDTADLKDAKALLQELSG